MPIAKERIEYFALMAEIVGGLGVIISVIYLALQVGDGNKELRAQNHHNALTLAQRPMEMLIADKEIAALYVAGQSGANNLSEPDRARLRHYNFQQFNAWEFSYYQNEDKIIQPELWIGHDGWMREEARTNLAVKSTWYEMEHSFAKPFRSYVNQILSEAGETRN